MDTVKQYLALLFGAIVVGLVLTNPRGVEAIIQGLASFTGRTVEAFTGFRA